MSRIHEALKKAEQERGAAGPTRLDITAGGVSDPAVLVEDAPAKSTLAGAGVLEALARCRLLAWKPDASAMLFVNGNDGARGTEEYRTLRSRLYHLREKMPLKKLLVSSALPKEGKSFTAVNLAQVMARQRGRRVLLVDGDLRGPRLHLMLGTLAGPGLSDYLAGKNDEISIMQRGPVENLFLIPSGTSIEDPAELIGSGRLKLLMQRLETMFDWIIVDSPPAIPVSDASVLAAACDGVLLVVRANSTPADMARKARLEFAEQSLIGVVLNGRRGEAAPYERYYDETYQKKGNRTESQGK